MPEGALASFALPMRYEILCRTNTAYEEQLTSEISSEYLIQSGNITCTPCLTP